MVTLSDIAREAKVNKSTVSRALNGTGKISEAKKAEILKIAEKLGYVPDYSAKALAGKSAKTIGIILPEIDCSYYASVVGSIESLSNRNGYSILIGQTDFKYSNELQYLKLFTQKKVDGLICMIYDTERFNQEYKTVQKLLRCPVVFIETDPGISDHDAIVIDHAHGVSMAVEHLVSQGAKSIAFLSEEISAKIRKPAFLAAVNKLGISQDDYTILVGKERFEIGGYLRMQDLISSGRLPDAVLMSYDTMANGALRALSENGIRCPEDVLLASFDDIRECEYFSVPLTSVSPPVIDMSDMAVTRLLENIQNADIQPLHISLRSSLTVRESSNGRRWSKNG